MAILEAMEVVVALGVAKIKEIKEEILGTRIKEADTEVEEDKEVMGEEVRFCFFKIRTFLIRLKI